MKDRQERKQSKGQTFGKPFVIKCGKKIDMYDFIQAGRTDTEIYPTLEKYGCLDRMELDVNGVYADFTEMGDLRNTIEKANKADEMWRALPLEVREKFSNNKALFVENGEKWIKNIIKENEKKIKEQEQIVEQGTTETKKEEVNA